MNQKNQNQNEENIIKEEGPLRAQRGREERPVGRYAAILIDVSNAKVKSQYSKSPDGYDQMWLFEFEYVDQPGNTHTEFIQPYNSKTSKAYKIGCGMSSNGKMDEGIRQDLEKFSAFFMGKVGSHFEITLQPNKTGTRNVIGSIRPITEAEANRIAGEKTVESDEIPF